MRPDAAIERVEATRIESTGATILRMWYLSPTLRISRPMLDLEGSGGDGKRAIFVYARE